MDDDKLINRVAGTVRGSLTFKLLAVGFLVLLLLIPTSMVRSLIMERQHRNLEAIAEITGKWGNAQTLAGPVISIPYRSYYTLDDGSRRFNLKYAHFLPRALTVEGGIEPETRYRGIYRVVVYSGQFELRGRFNRPDFSGLGIAEEDVVRERAFIAMGIPDMKGIREAITVTLGDSRLPLNPGVETNEVLESGASARIPATLLEQDAFDFSLSLRLNGGDRILFTPVGEVTEVDLSSSWPTPSFDGAFLPVEREVNDTGFTAHWRVLHLNRNYPQAWTGPQGNVGDSAFGVRVLIPSDVYQQVTRTAKYAMLFILLTFTVFFFSEIIKEKRLHPIQYLLIGFALVIFYTLLIALSEHIRFGLAYLLASVAVVGLITLYAHWVLDNSRVTVLVGGILSVLYGYLYILLQLEDYALLMGSLGLFVALATVMYVTRSIDWYAAGEKNSGGIS
jgi:inner membrane protein